MTYRIRSVVAVAAVALGLLGANRSSVAATVYDSGGYETPRFVAGELAGQDTAGPWLKDGGTGVATVQSAVVQGGSQAVQFTRPGNASGDTRYGVLRPLTPTPPLTLLRISWDMNVTETTLPNVDFGPLFGVEGYDGFVPTAPKLIGSLGVDASTGDVLYQAAGSGALTETGTVVPFGQWQHFDLELDFSNQTYRGFVNGTQVVSSGFVDSGIVAFTDAPLAALAAGGDPASLAASGTAYFDNYTIEIVPEPGALALVGLASLGLLRRRRQA